jgi:hypothetical protein
MKGFSRISQVLALLAMRQCRVKNTKGQFEATGTVEPGRYRCWKCREVKDLTPANFCRQASKKTGFVSRCKSCDNKLKTEKRRAPRVEVERYSNVSSGR